MCCHSFQAYLTLGWFGPERTRRYVCLKAQGRGWSLAEGGGHLNAAVFEVFFHLHFDFGGCLGSGFGDCLLLQLHDGFFLHLAVKASPFTGTAPQYLFCVSLLQPIFEAELSATSCLGLSFNGVVKHSLRSNFFQDVYQCRWHGFCVD